MQNKIKFYREKKGLTQEQLAEKSGVSRNTISSLEAGSAKNITLENMKKIANALEKTVTTIFFNN